MFRKSPVLCIATLAVFGAATACSSNGTQANSTSASHATTPRESGAVSASSTGQPKTLEAAVKAEQETADRYTSGDFAGAWDGYSSAFQKGISRDDYAKLGQTCDGSAGSVPIKVQGVRLEGSNQAIVRLMVGSFGQVRAMTYEQTQWKQEPQLDFAKELGKPLSEIIDAEKAAGQCTHS